MSVLNITNLASPHIDFSLLSPDSILSMHHSIMFLDRVYISSLTAIYRWDLLTSVISKVFATDVPIL